jgi:hypothetical protein
MKSDQITVTLSRADVRDALELRTSMKGSAEWRRETAQERINDAILLAASTPLHENHRPERTAP